MISRRLFACALVCGSVLLLAACDPVRTTVQPVRFLVTSSSSGAPVKDACLSVKYDYEGSVAPADRREWVSQGYKWFSDDTGQGGEATVSVRWTMLDRSIGRTPPASRDSFKGIVYLVRVQKDAAEEVHSLVIAPGVSVRGPTFTIRVLGVEKPEYVRTSPGK